MPIVDVLLPPPPPASRPVVFASEILPALAVADPIVLTPRFAPRNRTVPPAVREKLPATSSVFFAPWFVSVTTDPPSPDDPTMPGSPPNTPTEPPDETVSAPVIVLTVFTAVERP
jgi:hypothetical protein